MDDIYNTMKINNLQKLNESGFNYDPQLICEKDNRYCQAIFSVPNPEQTNFTPEFYQLQNILSTEENGITYYINNQNFLSAGTFHFTFIQQITFNNYYVLSNEVINKYCDIMSKILYKYLPFKIYYNKLIAVTNGLVLCGDASININTLRDEYRTECKINNLPLIEPYYLNIIHSTLFRFTNKQNTKEFLDKYEYYLNNDVDYGYIVIDHFNFGKATWKVNMNEICMDYILKNNK